MQSMQLPTVPTVFTLTGFLLWSVVVVCSSYLELVAGCIVGDKTLLPRLTWIC